RYHDEGRRTDAEILDAVRKVAREVAIERYLAAPVFRVSPSVRKRALVARALVMEPELLLCDEPQARLTRREVKLVAEAFERRRRSRSMTMLLTGHNEEDFSPFVVHQMVHLERDPLSAGTSIRPAAGPVSIVPRSPPTSIPIILTNPIGPKRP